MADNPFLKYVEDEENPFLKYTKTQQKQSNPTDGMSNLDRFLAGTGKAFTDIGRGVGQKLGMVSAEDIEKSRKLDAALMGTGYGTAGNIFGNVAALAPTAMIPGANTITGAGAIGAVTGFMQPSTSNDETIRNTLYGGAGGAVVPAAIRAGQVAKSFVEPFYQGGRDQILGRAIKGAAGNQADDALRNLQMNRASTPGVQYTAAEAAKNPGISALQRTAVAVDPVASGDLFARNVANNESLVLALKGLANDRNTSVAARESATKALYNLSNGKTINLTPELESLLKRPVMQSAVGQARTLAANEGLPFSLKPSTPPQPSTLLNHNGNPISILPGTPGSLLGRDAHTIKRSLDDTIEGLAGQAGLGKNAKRAATGTKNQFLSELEKQVPEYGMARTTFADMSKPVNQADVADLILQRSTGNIQGNMTPAAFNRAYSDRTAQSALGRKSTSLLDVFEPNQIKTLDGIKNDLQAYNFAQNGGRGPGSDTVQKLAYSNIMAQSGMPNFVANLAPTQIVGNLAQKAGQVAYKDANKRMSEELAAALLDPTKTAELMKAGMSSKAIKEARDALTRSGIPLFGGLLATDWAQ